MPITTVIPTPHDLTITHSTGTMYDGEVGMHYRNALDFTLASLFVGAKPEVRDGSIRSARVGDAKLTTDQPLSPRAYAFIRDTPALTADSPAVPDLSPICLSRWNDESPNAF